MSGAREQVSRLLALVPYLQARSGTPLAKVAADFDTTPAQILKDLNVLWYCGMPGLGPGELIDIDFEALEDNPDGMVRIGNAEYLSRPVRLGSSEASALIVALRALREGSPESSREVVDRTLAKLEEATAGGEPAPPVQVLATPPSAIAEVRHTLEGAIARNRQVQLDYYVPTRDESTERVVDPIEILVADGRSYLDAWCHLAEARRLFRLDRVHGVQVLQDARVTHDVPPRDLSEGLFQPAPGDLTARLKLAPGMRWVTEYYPVTKVVEVADGSLEVTLQVGDPLWLVRLMLRLSAGAEILEPAELADQVRHTASAALALYGDGVA
jgi:proteasome accessory factor C